MRVRRQMIEQVAEIDIRHVAQRDHMREADIAPARPIDDASDQRA